MRRSEIVMREDAAWSPILREQGALEELAAIGVEIIRNARNELYLSMRFLDVTLNGLFPVADNSIKGIGTDGTLLSFETGYICGWYRRNPVYVNRMILHETFHCLFVTHGREKSGQRNTGIWHAISLWSP